MSSTFVTELEGRKITITPTDPIKFSFGDPAAHLHLEEHGYVVYKNMATQEELSRGVELFWNYMNFSFPKIKRDDVETWSNFNWPKWSDTGIISADGIGQSEFMWFVRTLPSIRKIFEDIWKDDDLVVSFDAAGVTRPPDYDNTWMTKGGWFHFDQNGYKKKGLHCIQGLLNFFPSGPTDGGLVVVPGTSLLFDKLFSKSKCFPQETDFIRLTKKGSAPDIWTNPKYAPIKLNLDPGDFVLWDSRTAHCNHPALPCGSKPVGPPCLKRLVSYVCMTPFAKVNNKKDYMRNRVIAFRDGITTSHWPHEYQPRGSVIPTLPKPEMTDALKALLVGNSAASKFDMFLPELTGQV